MEVPGARPVNTPIAGFIVATAGILLIHVPPGVASVRSMEELLQTTEGPEIVNGIGFTVTMSVLIQPPAAVYVIIAVPAIKPVIIPEELPAKAIPGADDDHVPPPVASDKVIVSPSHKLDGPDMDGTVALTVTIITAEQVVPMDV